MSRAAALLALLVSRCGGAPAPASSAPRYSEYAPAPEVAALVTEFERALGQPVGFPVRLVPPADMDAAGAPAGVVGLCVTQTRDGQVSRSVLLDSDYWYAADTAHRWALVFHELGHCRLGLDHRNTLLELDDWRCPASVMRFAIDGTAECLAAGKRTTLDYEQELFGARAPAP